MKLRQLLELQLDPCHLHCSMLYYLEFRQKSEKWSKLSTLSLHLECSVLGVESEAELNLAAVVSHDEAILPLLENDRVIDDVFSALSQS